MASRKKNHDADEHVQQVREALSPYKHKHPAAKIDVYRQNSVSIRIRIIDPSFRKSDRVEREESVWPLLEVLPDDVFCDLTMLLLLTPEEASFSLGNQVFEDLLPSKV